MSTFGAVVGERTELGRDEFVRYHAAAIDIPSPAISRIDAISKETGVFLVVGVIEREAGTLYCTAVFVHPEHGYVAKHRKLIPTATERVIWGQGDGSTLAMVATDFESPVMKGQIVHAKVTATICW
jgi:beta-cyano-L-alanine hydratase/nitrilase